MKKYLLLIALFLTGCATPVPTPNPAEVGMTMFADKINSEATQARIDSIFTATAQVYGVTATHQAAGTQIAVTQQAASTMAAVTQQARMDAQATADQRRADAQATQQRIDADATQAQARLDVEATADQARLDVASTQQAQGTAVAATMTQMVIPTNNLLELQQKEIDLELSKNELELSNLAVEQQRETNTTDWAVPTGIAIFLVLTASVVAFVYVQTREIKDEDGRTRVIITKGKAIKPDLFTGPVLDLKSMTMPQLAAPAEQARVTERAQMVDALAVMPVTTSNAAAGAFNQYFGQQKEAPYDIVDAVPAGLLDGEALKSIEKDWKEATDG
jgi:hypothetical protein